MPHRASKRARNRSASESDAREVSGAPGQPLDGRAVAPIFDSIFEPYRHVVLAVSGGVDSMAMMHLAMDWRASRLASSPAETVPIFSIVTVDHGLRPESASEAEGVQRVARRLGLAHTTLVWEGPKPATGIQAAARAARYRLIFEHLESQGIDVMATAHTSDDQAETLLMRLARGSGVDGLSGIQRVKKIGRQTVLRPMLSFAKADLIATLQAKGETWIEDPSNEKLEFERVRLRHMRDSLEAAGLSNRTLALSARRLGRARRALDEMTAYCVEQAGDRIRIDDLGYAEFSWPWILSLPEEIRLRILTRLIASIGGGEDPVTLSGLEAMTACIGWKSPAGHSLAGAVFSDGKKPDTILVVREFGRRSQPLPTLDLKSGLRREWDRRFIVVNASQPARDFRVCALGAEGVAAVKAACMRDGRTLPPHPLAALYAIPSFWDADRLAAVPLLNYFECSSSSRQLESTFSAKPFARQEHFTG